MPLNTRALIKAPCGYPSSDMNDKPIVDYPCVDCTLECKHCGWNPEEVLRRYREGTLVTKDGVTTLHFKRRRG